MGLTLRRLSGATLLAGAYLPLHRLLLPGRAGPAGISTRTAAEAAWAVGLYGSLTVVGVALALTLLVPPGKPARFATHVGDLLARPGPRSFAAAMGVLAFGLSLGVALLLFGGLPTSVDEMAQLLHARALVGGRLGVPLPGDPAAWSIQNGLLTAEGWASIYPPFHTVLLALGLMVGAPWLVGPAAVGVGTWASARAFEELLGPRTGRIAAAVLTLSPFWLLLGATYLSHTTAAAGLALVLWAGLRARDGDTAWAIAAGAAVGVAVSARPWIGLVSSGALLGVLWWPHRSKLAARAAGLVAGGLPFAALLLWWNARLFGSPFRLGYSAAFGPAHGLGLHVDPWGNVYGAREALAYTGADLTQLGAHLLETPLPVVALVGLALLVGLKGPATRPFLAWALAGVAANALYWHHGIHMGPRMLYETAPAWVALLAAAGAYLTSERVPGLRARQMAGWMLAVAGLGAFGLAPGVIASAARTGEAVAYATPPVVPTESNALVFVHGSWASRVVAGLSATGMRRDSVETALRRNDICAVQRYALWRSAPPTTRDPAPPELDLRPLPGTPAGLQRARLSPGNEVWTSPGSLRDPLCLREAAADRHGVVDLEPLLWQAPPLAGRAMVVARDMGREINDVVSAALGDPERYIYVPLAGGDPSPVLMDYEEGMQLLWGAIGGAGGS